MLGARFVLMRAQVSAGEGCGECTARIVNHTSASVFLLNPSRACLDTRNMFCEVIAVYTLSLLMFFRREYARVLDGIRDRRHSACENGRRVSVAHTCARINI